MITSKILQEYLIQHERNSLPLEDELNKSDEFKNGAEYGRSETLKKLLQYSKEIDAGKAMRSDDM